VVLGLLGGAARLDGPPPFGVDAGNLLIGTGAPKGPLLVGCRWATLLIGTGAPKGGLRDTLETTGVGPTPFGIRAQ
jgi:hypothetical protein